MRGRLTDLTGQRFDRWFVVRLHVMNRHGSAMWWCRCDCGREKPVEGMSLRNRTSLGCSRCARNRLFKLGASWASEDPEMYALDILADLESEFGEMRMPEPRGPVFHQSLSSDFELGIAS